MIGKLNITFWLIPMIFIWNGLVTTKQPEFIEVRHLISIKHPGEEDVIESVLTEVQNAEGLPIEYFMDVESVICLAKVCKIIPVRLYWTAIGEYEKYTLKKGATLEKYEADLFEPVDYEKIHSIMANPNSPFKDVLIGDIWTVPRTLDENVDALSGATILELNEEDTVSGAALTCYTLWHWANGDVIPIIKQKTGESVSKTQLKEFIVNENESYFNIALKELEKRKLYEAPFTAVIVQRVLKEHLLNKEAFVYFENLPSEMYLDAMSQLFLKGGKEQKLSAIRSLSAANIKIPKAYLDKFSEEFIRLESYQEVAALFELMQQKNPKSSVVNDNALPLLDSEFLIARRAYWFLSHQEVSTQIKENLQAFYMENKERL